MKLHLQTLVVSSTCLQLQGVNPLAKVVELLDSLAAKVTREGEAEDRVYKEYFEWCDETTKNGEFAVQTATKEAEKLTAHISKLAGDIESAGTKIDELASAISTAEKELKSAAAIRAKEAGEFAAGEKELVETIDMVGRAVLVLQKELAKSPSLAQVDSRSVGSLLQAVSAVLDAAAFGAEDKRRLSALVQQHKQADGDDDGTGFVEPTAAPYESKSGSIVEVLEDMKDKAEEQLQELRKSETTSKHNYEMLKQSLQDQLGADNKDLSQVKGDKAAAAEGKAGAEGDLEVAKKDLSQSKESLELARGTCMQTASDHEESSRARAEELKVIAEAKNVLQETSSGATSQAYALLQLGSRARAGGVLGMVKRLAKKYRSAALAQLASRIGAATRLSSAAGEDPFVKVKGLIADLIKKLQGQMESEATEKAFCDEQMAKSGAKQSELEDSQAKLTTKTDSGSARAAELQAQVKELQSELAALAKEQAELDTIRLGSHKAYEAAKADLELGISGVRKALSVVRDYYGSKSPEASLVQDETSFAVLMQQPAVPQKNQKPAGAGQGIIGLLEVVESDFAASLAKEETEEADAQSSYEKVTQDNKVEVAEKRQDVKYKTQEMKSLDSGLAQLARDGETVASELAAVDQYHAKLSSRCVAKPETYEERKRRREAEIAGLREALAVLEDEAALLQRSRRGGHRSFRGSALTSQ